MTRILRDPLVIFLAIGGGIFLLYSKVNPAEESAEADPYRIEITTGLVEQLKAQWESSWRRPPTDEELDGLVDAHVKEEIYYREAKKLGLDQADTIIRRRLAQKMEFLTSDLADFSKVDEETLAEYFAEKKESYRRSPQLGFEQIFFSPDKRSQEAEADAAKTLARFMAGEIDASQAAELGDRTMLAASFATSELPIIGRQFGQMFAEAIADKEAGSWIGPIPSSYGFHLVRITERLEGGIPELSEIREKVLHDYQYDQQEKLNQAILEGYLQQYTITRETTDS